MKPINRAERKKAFWNFLLFFLITVAVIVAAVLFSVQVPFKENDRLRKEADVAYNEKVFLQGFEIRMQETMNLLDSVNLSDRAFWFNNRIDHNIKEMTGLLNDSLSVKGL